MNIYAHLVIAAELEARLRPEDSAAYYWGAVAPDVRYLAGMRRNQTHLPPEKIGQYMLQYPHLKAFLQGYLIHCLTDEIDLTAILYRRFPFSLLKGKLSARQVAVLFELFYLENVTLNKTLSGGYNAVLAEMGISETQAETFVQAVTQYLSSPSFVAAISLAQQLGMLDDRRIDRYLAEAEQFQKSRIQKNCLFFCIRTGKMSRQIVAAVAVSLINLLPGHPASVDQP